MKGAGGTAFLGLSGENLTGGGGEIDKREGNVRTKGGGGQEFSSPFPLTSDNCIGFNGGSRALAGEET